MTIDYSLNRHDKDTQLSVIGHPVGGGTILLLGEGQCECVYSKGKV